VRRRKNVSNKEVEHPHQEISVATIVDRKEDRSNNKEADNALVVIIVRQEINVAIIVDRKEDRSNTQEGDSVPELRLVPMTAPPAPMKEILLLLNYSLFFIRT
jgi:hypothetical protein